MNKAAPFLPCMSRNCYLSFGLINTLTENVKSIFVFDFNYYCLVFSDLTVSTSGITHYIEQHFPYKPDDFSIWRACATLSSLISLFDVPKLMA